MRGVSCRLMVSEKSPEMFFDKIILHQNRKKPKPTWDSNGVALKPNYYIIDLLKKHGYAMLVCDYNYYHIAITYHVNGRVKLYTVLLETIGSRRQTVVDLFWLEDCGSQDEVIDYIRYRLR